MVDESAMQEILDNPRGHRVKTALASGELVELKRTKIGVQILFPERPRRGPMQMSVRDHQDELAFGGEEWP